MEFTVIEQINESAWLEGYKRLWHSHWYWWPLPPFRFVAVLNYAMELGFDVRFMLTERGLKHLYRFLQLYEEYESKPDAGRMLKILERVVAMSEEELTQNLYSVVKKFDSNNTVVSVFKIYREVNFDGMVYNFNECGIATIFLELNPRLYRLCLMTEWPGMGVEVHIPRSSHDNEKVRKLVELIRMPVDELFAVLGLTNLGT